MATSLPCDNHLDQQAAMLITNLDNGDTLTLCAACIGQWAVMLVGAFNVPETQDSAASATTEEAGQPEIAAATPDPEPKSDPEPDEAEAEERTYSPPTPQETTAASE